MGENHEEGVTDEFEIDAGRNTLTALGGSTMSYCELQQEECDISTDKCSTEWTSEEEQADVSFDVDDIIREIRKSYDIDEGVEDNSDETAEFTKVVLDDDDDDDDSAEVAESRKCHVPADAGGESMSSLSDDDSWSDVECNDDFAWDDYIPLSTLSDDTDALEMLTEEVKQDDEHYQTVKLGEKLYHIDLNVVKQYKGIISYGGTLETDNTAIFTISGHDLPQRQKKSPHYVYTMENLFLHAIITVDILSTAGYILVYFCGRSRKTLPPVWWLKKMYAILDKRLRKSVSKIYVVHPSFWMKAALKVVQPFMNSKLIHKIQMVQSLAELKKLVPMEFMYTPEEAITLDGEINKGSTNQQNSS
ncbi:protein prune homolog 2-like [Ptychodera flava]|uniref:protein prune homolog 2-like n=1 Tax=Ptychodera flava TaxID=63121 RepID=UPI003969F2BE